VAPQRESRKIVTVVFCDVIGSTALGERLDPESLRGVMARYFGAMRQVIERHGGTVEKFIGDAVMAVFGVPVLHEDDALRAVRAVVEMREALVLLNEELKIDYGTSLAVRIGVNTGEVVTGTEERLATGDAVNIAARLEQAASPDEIVIGAETLALVRDAVDVEPLAPLELRGKSEPLPAFRLVGVRRDAPGFNRRTDAPMVGRNRELRRMEDSFEQATADRSCQLFTVLGAAGVGKSRLAAELTAATDATVVQGRCLDYGDGITYWPVVEVLKPLLGSEAPERLRALGLDQTTAATILGLLGEAGAERSSEEIARAVREVFEAAARERPLVVVFDDIHSAEPTFLKLVEHVADLSRDAPIFLLCLARPELRDRRPDWAGGLLNATTVLLEPLSRGETDDLIRELLGSTVLPEAFRARIADAADGNPLFVEEMLVMLRESSNGDVSVPPTIQALLAARLDQLEPSERAVLERGSVEGKVFHRAAVLALAPEEAELGARLTSLVRKELVRPERATLSGEEAYRFRHLLIRDAAYEAVPKSVRAELHERFADWLELRGNDLVEQEEVVGSHLERAYRYRIELGPLDEHGRELAARAADRLGSAGMRANDRGDASAAASLLGRATELLLADDPGRLELRIELGRALNEGGELERAAAVLAETVDESAVRGDVRLESLARVQGVYVAVAMGGDMNAALGEARRAVTALANCGDEAALAQAETLLGTLQFWLGDSATAETSLQQALEHARSGGRSRDEADALSWLLVVALFGLMPVQEAFRRCEVILEQVRGTRSMLEAQSLLSGGVLYAMRGEFDRARAFVNDALSINLELGNRVTWGAQSAEVAKVELLAGDPPAAERVARAAYESLAQLGEKGYLSLLAARLARAVYLQGRYEEAEQFTRASEAAAAPDDVSSQCEWRAVRALICARTGQLDAAENLAREALHLIEGTDYLDQHADALVGLAEILHLSDQTEPANASARKALQLYERKGNVVSAGRVMALLEQRKTIPT
jgi:class 3 adenylate cyclase/tetratricopeptide (TPR) repeat protein